MTRLMNEERSIVQDSLIQTEPTALFQSHLLLFQLVILSRVWVLHYNEPTFPSLILAVILVQHGHLGHMVLRALVTLKCSSDVVAVGPLQQSPSLSLELVQPL